MTKNISDPALDLIKEIKSYEASNTAFGPSEEKKARQVIEKIKQLHSNSEMTASNPYVKVHEPHYGAYFQHQRAAILREKRCLVGYWHWRINKLTSLWWDGADHSALAHCTPQEKQFLQDYNNTLVEYMRSFQPICVDLRAFMARPPSCPPTQVVQVRGLKDHMYMSVVSMRPINIYAGKLSCIQYEDAEFLVQQGVVHMLE